MGLLKMATGFHPYYIKGIIFTMVILYINKFWFSTVLGGDNHTFVQLDASLTLQIKLP